MKLTDNFDLIEFTRSETAEKFGIDNTPNAAQIEALRLLCVNTLEPLRRKLGKAIHITSGYRCPLLNFHKAVGGSKTSQHLKGEAADIKVKDMTVQELFDFIIASGVPFDQIIQEFDEWVHISFSAKRQRRSILYAQKSKTKTVFSKTKLTFAT